MSLVLVLVMIVEVALLASGYLPGAWSNALCSNAFGLCTMPIAVGVALVVTIGLFFVQRS